MQYPWKVLKTEADYKVALKRTIDLFNADENTPEGEELDLLLVLVKDYEDRHFPIPPPNPIEAIKLKLEEKGLKQKDLEHIIGSKGYVSQVLAGKKELTLKMVRGLHRYLGISADVLLAESK
jgi:HTH-type transcriptional regulator/antitoxin HigA